MRELHRWDEKNFTKKYVKDGNSTKVYTYFNGDWLFVYRVFN